MNPVVIFLTALLPLVIGFVWYNPKVFGTAWMKASGVTPEMAAKSNMVKTFSLTYFFSLMLTIMLYFLVIHQSHLMSIVMNEPDAANPASEAGKWFADSMARYGGNFRTFKHGMLHGTISGILLAFPITGVAALFEMKSAKYIFINAGFWVVCMMLMGGFICQFG
ncbi:MAG: DUF1761 domain-containing protein [Saprospiraceae bacterium]